MLDMLRAQVGRCWRRTSPRTSTTAIAARRKAGPLVATKRTRISSSGSLWRQAADPCSLGTSLSLLTGRRWPLQKAFAPCSTLHIRNRNQLGLSLSMDQPAQDDAPTTPSFLILILRPRYPDEFSSTHHTESAQLRLQLPSKRGLGYLLRPNTRPIVRNKNPHASQLNSPPSWVTRSTTMILKRHP